MTEHMLQQYALDNQRDILAADKGDKEAAKRVQARREAAIIVAAASGGGMALTAGGMTLVGSAPSWFWRQDWSSLVVKQILRFA